MSDPPAIRLAAFDMDGTLVDTVSSWGYVHHYFGENNDESLRAFMNNEIDDAEFVRRDLALWHRHVARLTDADLVAILASVPIMPGALELMGALRAHGIQTVIVSGGLDHLADRVRDELGMDRSLANGFETDPRGAILRGKLRVPVKQKETVLRRVQQELGVSPEETASVGNSEIDVGLFRASRIRIAFQPQDETVVTNSTHVVREKDLRLLIPLILESRAAIPH